MRFAFSARGADLSVASRRDPLPPGPLWPRLLQWTVRTVGGYLTAICRHSSGDLSPCHRPPAERYRWV